MSGAETINSAVRERPILFSGPMVRAILEGRKTQTRRVIRPQPMVADEFDSATMTAAWQSGDVNVRCPYGQPGDRLWVRETYLAMSIAGGPVRDVMYSDWEDYDICYPTKADKYPLGWKVVPAIHMPRSESRLTLEITEVRVQRLQEISNEEAAEEGIEQDVWDQALVCRDYSTPDKWFQMWSDDMSRYVDLDDINRQSFRTLWDSINAKRAYGWDANPWVWAISFKPVDASGSSRRQRGEAE
jgi:hypothetical protein